MRTLRTFLTLALSLLSAGTWAQTAQIAANSLSFKVTINGTVVTITGPPTAITIPVTLPSATAAGQVLTSTGASSTYTAQTPSSSSGGGLPSGLTFANGVFTVSGSISAASLALTGGPALPACASNLYFLTPSSSGSTTLQPSCYTVPTLSIPPIAVASNAANIITLTLP